MIYRAIICYVILSLLRCEPPQQMGGPRNPSTPKLRGGRRCFSLGYRIYYNIVLIDINIVLDYIYI